MRKISLALILILAVICFLLLYTIQVKINDINNRDLEIYDLETNLTECQKEETGQTICFNPLNCVADKTLLGCKKILNNWCCCKDMVEDNVLIVRPNYVYECDCTKNLYDWEEIEWME